MEASSSPESNNSSPLVLLARFLNRIKASEEQINIPTHIHDAVRQDLKAPQYFPAAETLLVVEALESSEPSLCSRLTSRAFIVIFAVFRASEPSWALSRGLCLLTESIFEPKPDRSTSLSASQDCGSLHLTARKARIGAEILPLLLSKLCKPHAMGSVRRWTGLLASELLNNSPENQKILELGPEDIRLQLGRIVVHETNEVLRLIAWSIVRELVSNGASQEIFWPGDSNAITYLRSFNTEQHEFPWLTSFQLYLDTLHLQRKISYKQTVFSASGLQFGYKEYPAVGSAVILVPVERLLSVIVPTDGSAYIRLVDVPLENILRTTLQEGSTTDEVSSIGIQMDIHLTQGTHNTVYVNGMGYSVSLISLLFSHTKTAKDLEDGILRSQELIEKDRLLRFSYAPPQDISEKDSGISVGPDGYSTTAEYEDLMKIAVEAENLVQVQSKERTSKIGRVASIQSPIFASIEPETNDKSIVHSDQQRGSREYLELLTQNTDTSDLNDLTLSAENPIQDHKAIIVPCSSKFLGQLSERQKLDSIMAQSTISYAMITQGSRKVTKICQRMCDRQGQPAKSEIPQESSEEMDMNSKHADDFHAAHQKRPVPLKAMIDRPYRKKESGRKISSSNDMESVTYAKHSLFDIPESPKEAHKAQTKPNLKTKMVTSARSSLQDLASGRKMKEHRVFRTRDKCKDHQQTGSTDLVKPSSRSNIVDSSDSPTGDLILLEKNSDRNVPNARLKAKGLSKKDLGQQRPTKNLDGIRKKPTRQRKPATTAISRPVSKRRAAVQATMKIRGVALNENALSQVSPQQTTVPDLSFTRASNSELDAKEESSMAVSSPKGAAVSYETEPELQGSQEKLETQPSTPSPLGTLIEIDAGEQPLEEFNGALLPMDLSKCSEESSKSVDDHYGESTIEETLVSPNNNNCWKPLESATSPEALNYQAFQTVDDPPHSVVHAEVSGIAGLADRTTLYAEEIPLSICKGDLLENLTETAPECHENDLEEEANHHFEDAMTFVDIEDHVASMQPLQHFKQQEAANEYTMISTPEPQKILLRHTDYAINGQQSLSTTDSVNERSGECSKDLIDPFASKRHIISSNYIADIPQDQVLEGNCHPHVKQEKVTDISKIGSSSLKVLEQDVLEQGVGMSLEDEKDISSLLTTSHQTSTFPALRNVPEAVMVSSEMMAERDRLVRARVAAKSQLTNVIDISSNEEVDDDSIECSKTEASEKSEVIVLEAKSRGKHTLEEVDHLTSKRLKPSQPVESPAVLSVKDLGESVSLSSTKEHTLRKSAIISFCANGPRNQGILSAHTFIKNNFTRKQDSSEKAAETELSKKRKSFSKSPTDLDHTPVLLRVKRSKILKTGTSEDHISPSTIFQDIPATMSLSKSQDSTPPVSKSLSPRMDIFTMNLDDSLPHINRSQTSPALPPNTTPSVTSPGRGSTTPFPNVPRPRPSAPAPCSDSLHFPKVPSLLFQSFAPSTITSNLKFHSELQALEAPLLPSQSQSLALSIPGGLQTPTPHTPWERPALNPSTSNSPRLRTQQAAATGRKTSTMKGMKINFDGSPVPKGHPSLVYHERRPAASRQGEVADFEQRANGSGKKCLIPSSALGKRLPSSPTAPSGMLEGLDAHAIYPDGRLINIRTANFVRAVDLEDPFTGEVNEWTAGLNPVHQKMLAKVLPDKEAASQDRSFRGEDHGGGPSTGETLGEWGTIPQDKKTPPSDPSSSSSPSQPLEDESPEEVTREWREKLESHQEAMLEALQDVANWLVSELVDEELAVNKGVVLEYRRQACKMIIDLYAQHKHDYDAQRVRVDKVASGLVKSLGVTKGMLEGVARKMKEERVRMRELAKHSRAENQGVLDRLDAL